jgi:hypothetical protein
MLCGPAQLNFSLRNRQLTTGHPVRMGNVRIVRVDLASVTE